MIRNIKSILVFTGSASVLLTPFTSFAGQSPCDIAFNKDAVHCAFIGNNAPQMTGKYLKIKEIQKGHPAVTRIFCAVAGRFPVMNIPQNFSGAYHAGDQMTWQFSQCLDEDCSQSQLLVDDKFTITQSGNVISSGPKNKIEVQLDPGYGVDCKTAQKNRPIHGAFNPLQAQVDDMVALLNYVPQAVDAVIDDLSQMEGLASQAANGVNSSTQLNMLDQQFQVYKNDISRIQNVSTLGGVKALGGGALTLSQPVYRSNSWNLTINAPLTNLDSLGLAKADLESVQDAEQALAAVTNAISIIYNTASEKK